VIEIQKIGTVEKREEENDIPTSVQKRTPFGVLQNLRYVPRRSSCVIFPYNLNIGIGIKSSISTNNNTLESVSTRTIIYCFNCYELLD
jgi:hypothetical protein